MSRSDARPPAIRLRVRRGGVLLLWTPPRSISRGIRVLALVADRRPPRLRCLIVRSGPAKSPLAPRGPFSPARSAGSAPRDTRPAA